MEASNGRNRTWRRRIVPSVAIALLAFGVMEHLKARRLESEFNEAHNVERLRLDLDITRPGEQEGIIESTYRKAVELYLQLRFMPAFGSAAEARGALDGLQVSLRTQGEDDLGDEIGKFEVNKQITASQLVGEDADWDQRSLDGILWMGDVPPGRHRVHFKVLSPAPLAGGHTLRLSGFHLLCGMEVMPAYVHFFTACGFYVVGLPLIIFAFWRRKPRTEMAGLFCLAWLCAAASLAGAEAPPPPAGMGTLSGTVIDAATGLPAACTVKIVDSAGRTVTESASFQAGFRSDGRFKKRLPAGRARLLISRGPETQAVEKELDVPAEGEVDLQIKLERRVDLRKRGWFAGDNHVHMLHGERTVPVGFDDVALAARAEDLSFLSLAQDWALGDPTPEKLAAELAPRSTADCFLTWNLEAPKNYYRGDATRCLGHNWCLGVGGRTEAGDDVIDLLARASAHDFQSDKPTFANFESQRLIHAQGGAVFYTHPARWWTGTWGGQGIYPKRDNVRVSNMAVELPLDTLIGPTFDGLDVMTTDGEFEAGELAFKLWCLLQNHGYRMSATASSDACFDRPGGAVPGSVRTYAWLAEGFSLPAVTRAIAAGRTFATSGPILLASCDGKPPGSVLEADGTARNLSVEAWASGTDAKGLTRLELYRDGKLFKAQDLSPPVQKLETSFDLGGSEDAWYCLRLAGGDRRQRAFSGAFYFDRSPHRSPSPVPARVQVELVDADGGARISGAITELYFHATQPRRGTRHPVPGGERLLEVPADARLEADVPGYRPLTLSPFLDHAPLLEFITQLKAEDLVDWETFERVRALLGEIRLTFRLRKMD